MQRIYTLDAVALALVARALPFSRFVSCQSAREARHTGSTRQVRIFMRESGAGKVMAKHAKMLKETVFEDYYSFDYETDFLTKEPKWKKRGLANRVLRTWFHRYLRELAQPERMLELAESKDEEASYCKDEEPETIYFSDLFPRSVFRLLSKEPDTKFRFRIVVEAEQV